MSTDHCNDQISSTQAGLRQNAPGIGLDQRELVAQFRSALDDAGLGTPDILAGGVRRQPKRQ